MKRFATLHAPLLACAVAALFLGTAGVVSAEDANLDQLFSDLATPDNPNWERVESDILREWSKSGSAAMDLLLKRGETALEEGDFDAAIEHLTALTDHAPGFAEGWNARATAYFLAGYYGPSMADIARVLALEPRHFGAMSGLGTILEETGDLEGALAAYRKALDLHPNRFDIAGAVERLEHALQGVDL